MNFGRVPSHGCRLIGAVSLAPLRVCYRSANSGRTPKKANMVANPRLIQRMNDGCI